MRARAKVRSSASSFGSRECESSVLDASALTARLLSRTLGSFGDELTRLLLCSIALHRTCGACVAAIEGALAAFPGIVSVKVALLAERAIVLYDPAQGWSSEKVVDEIGDIGFDAFILPPSSSAETNVEVYGLPENASPAELEPLLRTLGALPGVQHLSFPEEGRASLLAITYTPALTPLRDLVTAIQGLGLDAVVSSPLNPTQLDSLKKTREIGEWRRTFYRSLAFAVPVFVVGMVAPRVGLKGAVDAQVWRAISWGDLVQGSLTIPVQVWLGRRFYVNAWKAAQHKYVSDWSLLLRGGVSSSDSLPLLPFQVEHDGYARRHCDNHFFHLLFRLALGRFTRFWPLHDATDILRHVDDAHYVCLARPLP